MVAVRYLYYVYNVGPIVEGVGRYSSSSLKDEILCGGPRDLQFLVEIDLPKRPIFGCCDIVSIVKTMTNVAI